MSRDDLKGNLHQSKLREDTLDSVTQQTRIWQEIPSTDNSYQVDDVFCCGYNLFELAKHCSYEEAIFLLFRGELPSEKEKVLFRRLLILFINPGPRHPATRAGVTAAASMTYHEHLVPIISAAFGGRRGGAGRLVECMALLDESESLSPEELLHKLAPSDLHDDSSCLPGVGSEYGSADNWTKKLLNHFSDEFDEYPQFARLEKVDDLLRAKTGAAFGLMPEMIVACAFKLLGIRRAQATGLYQLVALPGMFAHAAEYVEKPANSLPFIKDEHYVIEY
ncbi:MAG: hypothetical protein R3183_02495 [Oleiphilaceae bacterium]|nr:hypothetical protein [Oleiphilaceae bacterium]